MVSVDNNSLVLFEATFRVLVSQWILLWITQLVCV